MKTLNLLIMLLSPLLTVSQSQFVTFQAEHSSLEIAQASATLILTFAVEETCYIQADEDQIENEYLIPTRLVLEPMEGVRFCQMAFSPPQATKAFGQGVNIHVFEGTFRVEIEVEAGLNLASGDVPLKGTLFYQASDDFRCFPPKTLSFEGELEIITP